ncbi:MAG: glycosyltransferase family 2 protein [Rhodanobacter sp.]|jgi:GT2 family glycosyltransferase|nr:glycosyltransferase family 2 protein [Rhodanobacter sp.]
MNEMNYGIIILNWNGASDTVACLKSIFNGKNSGRVIVIDNGSSDDSLSRINTMLREHEFTPKRLTGTDLPSHDEPARVFIVEAEENLGFAAGCNLGSRVAEAIGCEIIVFLNNDTIIEFSALDSIVQRLQSDGQCFVCLPMITIYGSDRIWNCGGVIYKFGFRRYYMANQLRADGARRKEIHCSFFTGCCFSIRTVDFLARNGFSERFFFGEEDFELALWMKERKLSAVCLTSAVVQHKVGATVERVANIRTQSKVFVHYLNRFIHMRLRLGSLRWWMYIAAYLPYVLFLLWRTGEFNVTSLAGFVRNLLVRARTMNSVTRADFEAVMSGKLQG